MTTIKVESSLRDRINEIAREEGVSVSRALEGLVAERERAERFRRLRDDVAALGAEGLAEYESEVSEWDATLSDGLSGASGA